MATKQLIQTVTVGAGGAASIDFTSIPQTGTDLLLVVSARSQNAIIYDSLFFGFNGSNSNFSARYLRADGSSPFSNTWSNAVSDASATGNSATANTFGNFQLYIPNYTGSTNKSLSIDSVTENNATNAYQYLHAGLWANTAAITSLNFVIGGGGNVGQHSTASLYLITKGSGGASVS